MFQLRGLEDTGKSVTDLKRSESILTTKLKEGFPLGDPMWTVCDNVNSIIDYISRVGASH